MNSIAQFVGQTFVNFYNGWKSHNTGGCCQNSLREITATSNPAVTEFRVATPGGLKQHRFVDVAALDVNRKPVEFHQVGRATQSGFVAREIKAASDIYEATQVTTVLHAYAWP
jgi:hypothetical protein